MWRFSYNLILMNDINWECFSKICSAPSYLRVVQELHALTKELIEVKKGGAVFNNPT